MMKLNGAAITPTVFVGAIPKDWYNGYGKAWGFGDPLPAAARDDSDVYKILADAVPFAQWKKPEPDPEQQQPFEWREPEPIDVQLLPVPAFDANALLPDGLRDFVVDEAYRMCAPVEYVAAANLSITSSLIGANCAIRPKRCDNWLVVPNLWGANIGVPGDMKSPAMKAASGPLGRIIKRAAAMQAEEIADAKIDKSVDKMAADAKKKAVEKKIKDLLKGAVVDLVGLNRLKDELKEHQTTISEDEDEEEPPVRRFKTNDPSVEKIGELLRDNPGGLLYVRDELVGILASWDKVGREGDREFYLEA
jgi:hypothetical protein